MNEEQQKDLVHELADIHASLKVLNAGQEEICRRLDVDVKSRLDKVNGSISTLFQRTDDNKEALLNHVIDCPQKERIDQIGSKFDQKDDSLSGKISTLEQKITKLDFTIGEQLAASKAVEAQSSQWKDKLLFPLIRIAVTGLVLILLYHAKELLHK
jgi:hypothetical protein